MTSGGERLILQNIGSKGEQKIDLVVVSGDIDNNELQIEAAVEAKYLRNCHRYEVNNSAKDEIPTALKELKEQTGKLIKKTHGGHGVHLHSHTNEIYGLVFASFVSEKKNDPSKEEYFLSILNSKHSACFKYHDLDKPYFRKVYDDEKIIVLGSPRYATMRVGLWKKK
jgi:hypothetical protein